MTTEIKVGALSPENLQRFQTEHAAPTVEMREEGDQTEIESVASITSTNSADTVATGVFGTAEQKSNGFESYTMTLGRWTWDAVKPDRANLTKWYNLSTARRVLAGIVAVVSLPFAVIGDAFRGIAYNLPKSWKFLHNSGTAPLRKMAAPLYRQLLPSRDAFKASARRLAEAYDHAGAAYQQGNTHAAQPQKIMEDQLDSEFKFLAPHFEGRTAEECANGLKKIKAEMEKYTESKPSIYVTNKDIIKKSTHAINGLKQKLRPVFAQTIAEGVVGEDGTVHEQKQTQLMEQFKNERLILIPSIREFSSEVNKAVQKRSDTVVLEMKEKKEAEDQQQAVAEAARKNAEIKQETATRAEQTQKVADITKKYDTVSGCVEQMIVIQEKISKLCDTLNEDLTVREGFVDNFKKHLRIACAKFDEEKKERIMYAFFTSDPTSVLKVIEAEFGEDAKQLVSDYSAANYEDVTTLLEAQIHTEGGNYRSLDSQLKSAWEELQSHRAFVVANSELSKRESSLAERLRELDRLTEVVDKKLEET